jgi:hypothetical protein
LHARVGRNGSLSEPSTLHGSRRDDAVALKHGCAPGGIAVQD